MKIGITYANCHFCVGCICIHIVVAGLSWSKAAFFSAKQCCLMQNAKDNEKVLILYSKIKQFCFERRKFMSSALTKMELLTLEEWQELGALLKYWVPYTESAKKRSMSEIEKYMAHEYGMDCGYHKKVDFYINEVVYRVLETMVYRNEIAKLDLCDGIIECQRITGEIDRLLLKGSGKFSKKPAKRMRESDGRVLELCKKYLNTKT